MRIHFRARHRCVHRVFLVLHQPRDAIRQYRHYYLPCFIIQRLLWQSLPCITHIVLRDICLDKLPCATHCQIFGHLSVLFIPAAECIVTVHIPIFIIRCDCISVDVLGVYRVRLIILITLTVYRHLLDIIPFRYLSAPLIRNPPFGYQYLAMIPASYHKNVASNYPVIFIPASERIPVGHIAILIHNLY